MPDTTDDGASDSWRKLMERIAAEPVSTDTPDPPDWITEQCPDDYQVGAQIEADDAEQAEATRKSMHRMLDLSTLATVEPPTFPWYDAGWLSPHPTLLSGRGGVGKSLLALQIGIARAAGIPFLTQDAAPRQRVLYWACEDDADELHRRIARCCHHMGVSMASLAGWLHVDCRLGLDNILMSVEYGKPMWAPAYGLLREQLNDLDAHIWLGDNIAHMFAGSENDRTPVTVFGAGIAAARGVPYCPLLLGHVAKAQGSEYAGSTAWENCMRMRLFMGRTLPDQHEPDEDADDSIRVLAKRKSNYSADDIIRFRITDGVLVPERAQDVADEAGGMVAHIRRQNARQAVLKAIGKVAEMGMVSSPHLGKNYLPAQMAKYGLMAEYRKPDIVAAMDGLLTEGAIKIGPLGKDKGYRERFGLVISA